MSERLLHAREVAELLNVPVSWVRESTRSGAMPCVPSGGIAGTTATTSSRGSRRASNRAGRLSFGEPSNTLTTMRTRRHPDGMADLRRATRAFERAESRRDGEIFRAFAAGNSLRSIAAEVGLSHESVRSIVVRVGKWAEGEGELLRGTADVATLTDDQRRAAERAWQRRREHLDWLLSVKDSDDSGLISGR
jgi:DNA-binding CsgD family transcriptional regulator